MKIELLPKEIWRGHGLDFTYETRGFYEAVINESPDAFGVEFRYRAYDAPRIHKSTGDLDDALYADWWEGAEAYGILSTDGKNELCAVIELCPESWSNRMRVTEMWVAPGYRRRGCGKALMDHAKRLAAEGGYRCLMLETQSCNEAAIAFYRAQGLRFIGFDACCYGNGDVARGEVRVEMGIYL